MAKLNCVNCELEVFLRGVFPENTGHFLKLLGV